MRRYDEYGEKGLKKLIGSKISKIQMSEDSLIFTTDKGVFGYIVEGDCCSSSYFHDFIGVKKLLMGNPVVSVASIPLELPPEDEPEDDWEDIKCYGFEIVTDDPKFGELTSVFSFRNSSNGYYGGMMYPYEPSKRELNSANEITKDMTL